MQRSMSMKQAFAALGAAAMVMVLVVAALAVYGLRRADLALHAAEARAKALDVLRSEVGYGGAIHVFKNLVLRGGEPLAQRFEKHHARA